MRLQTLPPFRGCSCWAMLLLFTMAIVNLSPFNNMGITLVGSSSAGSSVLAYSTTPTTATTTSRRGWLLQSVGAAAVFAPMMVLLPDSVAQAAPAASTTVAATTSSPLPRVIEAQETLQTLLENWKRATVDCTFADVPRELLETKNKELLLEKASTYALFDKSVSVETCKTTNKIVRDYLGVTNKGPLVGMDKLFKRGLEYIDPDDLEDYVGALESFSQAYSRAASLSYAAGTADFDSVNNFAKDDDASDSDKKRVPNENSNLEQARRAIVQAKENLDQIVAFLEKGVEQQQQ